MDKLFSNRTYDVLKWLVLVFLPALTTFVGVLGAALGWPNTDTVLTIMVAVTTFLGSLLGISNIQYKQNK